MNSGKWLLLLPLTLTGVACRHDMQQQPKYTPLSRSWFFADGRSARPIPPGTIATDEVNLDPATDLGAVNGQFVTTIPIPVTADLLARGQERFDIYCSPCHGRSGFGNGMIHDRGFEAPANLNGDRVRNAPPGYIFQVIANGYGAMAAYGYQVTSSRDRWGIVAYIRALELSQGATLADVPADQRSKLEAQP